MWLPGQQHHPFGFQPQITSGTPYYPFSCVIRYPCSQCPRSEGHRAYATGCLSTFRTYRIQARLQPLPSHTSRGGTSAPDGAKASPADLCCEEEQDGRYQRHAQYVVTCNQRQTMACYLTCSQLLDTMPRSRTKPTATGQRFARKEDRMLTPCKRHESPRDKISLCLTLIGFFALILCWKMPQVAHWHNPGLPYLLFTRLQTWYMDDLLLRVSSSVSLPTSWL